MLGNEGKKEDTVGLKMDFCDILRHFECNFSLSAHPGNSEPRISMFKSGFRYDHSGSSVMSKFEGNKSICRETG